MECGLGREKIRSVLILLTWLQHGRGARLENMDAGRPGRTQRTMEQGLEG